jgi:hypothetical protein
MYLKGEFMFSTLIEEIKTAVAEYFKPKYTPIPLPELLKFIGVNHNNFVQFESVDETAFARIGLFSDRFVESVGLLEQSGTREFIMQRWYESPTSGRAPNTPNEFEIRITDRVQGKELRQILNIKGIITGEGVSIATATEIHRDGVLQKLGRKELIELLCAIKTWRDGRVLEMPETPERLYGWGPGGGFYPR